MSEVSSESDAASSSEEGEVKEEEPAEDSLEYESDSSYHAPPVGSEVTTLVPIEEEDEVYPLGFQQLGYSQCKSKGKRLKTYCKSNC